MGNLFSALLKRRGSQEDFLTESFRVVLDAWQQQSPDVCRQILREGFGIEWLQEGEIEVMTQVEVRAGSVPDMVLRCGKDVVFVENKWDSEPSSEQLERYAEICRCESEGEAVVVLLTARAHLLEDWCREHGVVSVKWNRIYRVLSDVLEQYGSDSKAGFLTDQFVKFLEEEEIVMPKVGWQLVDGMRSFRALIRQLREAVTSLGEKVESPSGGQDFFGVYFRRSDLPNDFRLWLGIFYNQSDRLWIVVEKPLLISKTSWLVGFERVWDKPAVYRTFDEMKYFHLSAEEQVAELRRFVDETVEKVKNNLSFWRKESALPSQTEPGA